jgi:hypothetical protein
MMQGTPESLPIVMAMNATGWGAQRGSVLGMLCSSVLGAFRASVLGAFRASVFGSVSGFIGWLRTGLILIPVLVCLASATGARGLINAWIVDI